uniref:Uncharacterized protein n=1 Tax=Ditylenchus dipsaci TaxID=166011 RepID=A0A915EEH8_9BILA
MVKPTKKMRTKSNPKISVRDILSGPSPSITPSLDKVPKRDMSEISSSALKKGNIIPMGAVPQVFAHNAPGGQPNKTATHSTVGFQLPLHVQTSGSSARASPSSYSDASTVSPSTYHQQQNSASLRAGTGFRVETSRGVVPAPVDPFLAQSQQSTLMTSNPMQNPELHSRFVQLFDQHQGQQTQSMPPTLQQQQPLIPMTYGQQQAQPSHPTTLAPIHKVSKLLLRRIVC